jgi:AraC-like DNA-binding protein
MPQIWSTANVHPRDKIAYWVDELCRTVARADCEPRRDQLFFGEIYADTLGCIGAVTYSLVAQVFTRSPRQTAHQPANIFTFGLQLAGDGLASQDGRDTVLRPGELVLIDAMRPSRLAFAGSFVRTTLAFPRSTLLRRLGHAEHFIGKPIDGTMGVGGLLSPLLRELPSRANTVPAALQERVAENLLDLIATALLADRGEAPLSPGMTLVQVKVWIEAHLGEPLSADCIAAACCLSVRHLNRLFRHESTSLMRYVWKRRLARCHRDLSDPAMRKRLVSDIAFSAGFNDFSHFSRAYRARYGCTPRDTQHGSTGQEPSTA